MNFSGVSMTACLHKICCPALDGWRQGFAWAKFPAQGHGLALEDLGQETSSEIRAPSGIMTSSDSMNQSYIIFLDN